MPTINKLEWDFLAQGVVDDFRTNYSGRGMFGRTCVAIVGTPTDLVHFVLEVEAHLCIDPDNADLIAIRANIGNVSWDAMGKDMIFYWPSISVKNQS